MSSVKENLNICRKLFKMPQNIIKPTLKLAQNFLAFLKPCLKFVLPSPPPSKFVPLQFSVTKYLGGYKRYV